MNRRFPRREIFTTLVTAAEHSIGSREAQSAARIELKTLLADYEMYTEWEAGLMELIEKKIKEGVCQVNCVKMFSPTDHTF